MTNIKLVKKNETTWEVTSNGEKIGVANKNGKRSLYKYSAIVGGGNLVHGDTQKELKANIAEYFESLVVAEEEVVVEETVVEEVVTTEEKRAEIVELANNLIENVRADKTLASDARQKSINNLMEQANQALERIGEEPEFDLTITEEARELMELDGKTVVVLTENDLLVQGVLYDVSPDGKTVWLDREDNFYVYENFKAVERYITAGETLEERHAELVTWTADNNLHIDVMAHNHIFVKSRDGKRFIDIKLGYDGYLIRVTDVEKYIKERRYVGDEHRDCRTFDAVKEFILGYL